MTDRPSKRRKIDTTHPQSEDNESLVLPGPSGEFNPNHNSTVINEESSPEKTLEDNLNRPRLKWNGKFYCPTCRQPFKYEHNLKSHIISKFCINLSQNFTKDAKRWVCNRCDCFSKDPNYALRHLIEKHDVGHPISTCPECNEDFSKYDKGVRVNKIKLHIDNNHPEYYIDYGF